MKNPGKDFIQNLIEQNEITESNTFSKLNPRIIEFY